MMRLAARNLSSTSSFFTAAASCSSSSFFSNPHFYHFSSRAPPSFASTFTTGQTMAHNNRPECVEEGQIGSDDELLSQSISRMSEVTGEEKAFKPNIAEVKPRYHPDQEIINYYNEKARAVKCFKPHIEKLIKQMTEMLQMKYNNKGIIVYPFGSTYTYLDLTNSDIDLVVRLPGISTANDTKIKKKLMHITSVLHKPNCLKGYSLSNIHPIAHAKVPIIKFVATHQTAELYSITGTKKPANVPVKRSQKLRFNVDLSINNYTGVFNSHYILQVSLLDQRFCYLVFLLKDWATTYKIKDASQQKLSSYIIMLMLIYYLQNVVTPPVLPNVFDDPIVGKRFSDVDNIGSYLRLTVKQIKWKSDCKESICDLFIGFMDFYSKIDWTTSVLSIRDNKIKPRKPNDRKSHINPNDQNMSEFNRLFDSKYFMALEDPLTKKNAMTFCTNAAAFHEIMSALHFASDWLKVHASNLKESESMHTVSMSNSQKKEAKYNNKVMGNQIINTRDKVILDYVLGRQKPAINRSSLLLDHLNTKKRPKKHKI